MTISETKDILNKIKAYRYFFSTGNGSKEQNAFVKEWFKVLEPYDFDDVEKKLDEYFRDGNNIGQIPDAYYLTKYLSTHKEKRESEGIYVACNICKEYYPQHELQKHSERCVNVNFVCRNSEKYFNKKLDRHKLLELEEEEFDKRYLEFVRKLKEKTTDERAKERYEKIVNLLSGENNNLTLSEMI